MPARETNICENCNFNRCKKTQGRADSIVAKTRGEILTNTGGVAHWVR
jgi:hypothetical protein